MLRVEGWVIISALRYALGRHSYITGMTADLVRDTWDSLDIGTKGVIKRDVAEFVEQERRREQDGITQLDLDIWSTLDEWLSER